MSDILMMLVVIVGCYDAFDWTFELEEGESPLIYTDSTIKGPMPAVMSLSWENDE